MRSLEIGSLLWGFLCKTDRNDSRWGAGVKNPQSGTGANDKGNF